MLATFSIPTYWQSPLDYQSRKYGSLPRCLLQFSSVQLLSCVWLFATPWTVAHQPSLSITNCQNLPKPMSIELVMPSNHLILCRPLLLLPSIFPSIRVFSNESALRIRWPKYWSFSFNISPFNEHLGLTSFRMDWLDLFVVQGILKRFLPTPHQERRKREDLLRELDWKQGVAVINSTLSDQLCNFKQVI